MIELTPEELRLLLLILIDVQSDDPRIPKIAQKLKAAQEAQDGR